MVIHELDMQDVDCCIVVYTSGNDWSIWAYCLLKDRQPFCVVSDSQCSHTDEMVKFRFIRVHYPHSPNCYTVCMYIHSTSEIPVVTGGTLVDIWLRCYLLQLLLHRQHTVLMPFCDVMWQLMNSPWQLNYACWASVPSYPSVALQALRC